MGNNVCQRSLFKFAPLLNSNFEVRFVSKLIQLQRYEPAVSETKVVILSLSF